jgi:uncharacterized protein YjeT (DUF2065 family)
MSDFASAIGLVLVIEGMLWALSPRLGRAMLEKTAEAPESSLRLVGVLAATIGLGVVWLARG